MEKVLLNLALISLNKFCKENGIDFSDTHAIKDGRGFKTGIKYSLIRDKTDKKVATVIFTKNTLPYFIGHK